MRTNIAYKIKVGKRHMQENSICQDAIKISQKDNFIAIADGVGSARYSKIGAEFAVTRFANLVISNKDNTDAINSIARCANSAIEVYARDMGIDYHDLACTFIMAFINNDGNLSVISVGDSYLLIFFEDGSYDVITEDKEYLQHMPNETNQLWSRNNHAIVKTFNKPVSKVIAFTDGGESILNNIDAFKDVVIEDIEVVFNTVYKCTNDDLAMAIMEVIN